MCVIIVRFEDFGNFAFVGIQMQYLIPNECRWSRNILDANGPTTGFQIIFRRHGLFGNRLSIAQLCFVGGSQRNVKRSRLVCFESGLVRVWDIPILACRNTCLCGQECDPNDDDSRNIGEER